MKIVMFHPNAEAAAIIQDNALSRLPARQHQPAVNKFLANGYADRFLWEEAATLQSQPVQPYAILGHWQ